MVRLVRFERPDGTEGFGTAEGGGVCDHAVRGAAATFSAFLADAARGAHGFPGADFAAQDLTLLAPIDPTSRIICVGLNFKAHIEETGREAPSYPTFFPRYPDSLVGHGQHMIRPRVSEQFDFEGELALVIGRGGRHIAEADAHDHIAGFMPFNDGSIRDFQYRTTQFMAGKCFWRSGAAGPHLVTPDEAGAVDRMQLTTRLNGRVVQQAGLDDLLFKPARLIAELSTIFPLRPGDVIATGTPGGVGVARKPPLFLRASDVIEVEIDALGRLSNAVADETGGS